MKQGKLNAFRMYLNANIANKNTADRYYFAVKKLLNNLQFEEFTELTPEYLMNMLQDIKTKNDFSAAKNGLKHLADYTKIDLPDRDLLKKTSLKKKNWSKRPPKTIYLDTVQRKINALKNDKLKLAYRLMLGSGARVSEVAALQKQDIKIDGNNIEINILHGKGGSNGKVSFDDCYTANRLNALIKPLSDDEQPFYNAQYMKDRANELGLECHDFRRIAAINFRYVDMNENGNDATTANEATKNFLRHARFSTTKRYLFNRKLKFKKPERIITDE